MGRDLEVVLIDFERFVEGFWIDFGKVLDVFLLNYLSFFISFCITCWKGFGKGIGFFLDSM